MSREGMGTTMGSVEYADKTVAQEKGVFGSLGIKPKVDGS